MIHVAILLLEISNFVTLLLPENLRSNYNNHNVFIDLGFNPLSPGGTYMYHLGKYFIFRKRFDFICGFGI